ncbi:hypothetical protein BC830DRAFT_1175333 [Chytriomyces sp. MP71]|nr:hypothetical protein BC830DRAFT_1175333 [Chytriomyces sp. MP71]
MRRTTALAAPPHFFVQRVVHSDGSSFHAKVTTPKAILRLTKDTRNHLLWNPSNNMVDDRGGDLARFASRFGDLSAFDHLAVSESVAAAPVQKKKAPPPAPAQAAAPAAKKKK